MITEMTAAKKRLDAGHVCLLITGAPGAGKSTISRLIADELTRSALMDSFFVGRLVASGYVWPLGEPADEAARQVRLQNANLCALASNFADAGFTPIIDIVLPDGEQLDTYRAALASHRLLLVVLDPGAEVCRHRNENRPPQQQFFFDGYDELRASMRRHFGSLGWWFDTSGLTSEQAAKQILDEALLACRRGDLNRHRTTTTGSVVQITARAAAIRGLPPLADGSTHASHGLRG